MQDLTPALRDRLLILLDRVQRDRAALDPAKHPDGDRIYAKLFDSLQSTLHNLNASAVARSEFGDGVQ